MTSVVFRKSERYVEREGCLEARRTAISLLVLADKPVDWGAREWEWKNGKDTDTRA